MNAPADYQAFLEAKVRLAKLDGFEVDPAEINPRLKPHIIEAVKWGLAGGRRALFSRFGTQKTTWHLETMRHVQRRIGQPTLITLPLGARLSFVNDAKEWFTGEHAIKVAFIRDDKDIVKDAINITNVESVREGKVDPRWFGGTSFDEGDILRNMNTKTFWTFTERAKEVPFRFVGTATPDPREYAELLAFAGYLDIMDVGQARTRFFKRDSERADKLTIHPHKEKEFWMWVASWALFIQKPSDVDPAFSDEGYELPPLDIRWHEIPADHSDAGEDVNGQRRLIKQPAVGVAGASKEKRDSLPARVAKMMELRAENLKAHRIIWHDLEAERKAIEKAAPEVVTVFGSQDLDEREKSLMAFAAGEIAELGGKPMMIGSGPNFQHHCAWAIFLGIGFKFKDTIQAVHRIQRYGQAFKGVKGKNKRVRIDFIYSEAERETRRLLEDNWKRYDEQADRMSALVREYGLTQLSIASTLKRAIGTKRTEVKGETYTCVNNDCVDEVGRIEADCLDLVVTSIPFSTQYEYTPSYNDFGHTDDDAHFFRQMDFLTPGLLRALKPGRVAVIHCKDRIVEGARSGLGFQTVAPFGARTMMHFIEHGFAYLGTKTIITDVVRENNQTYRLGWTEQCKDGSRMGFGLPEYLHVFRKPQTDRSRGYADEPVLKLKRAFDKASGEWTATDPRTGDFPPLPAPHASVAYSRARWQLDAAGFGRSSGNRLLTPAELAGLKQGIWRRYKEHSLAEVYDFEHHVACGEALDEVGKLPPDYAINPAHSWHPDVLTDIVRMRSLNTIQAAKGKEKHLCPLPFDIVNRAIAQYSMPGEVVFDPFGGLMTVPYCAILLKRRGYGVELSPDYFRDGVAHCRDAEQKRLSPTLFDLLAAETATSEAAE